MTCCVGGLREVADVTTAVTVLWPHVEDNLLSAFNCIIIFQIRNYDQLYKHGPVPSVTEAFQFPV